MTARREAGMQDLIELEKKGWQALSTGQEAGQAFYVPLLADGAVMLFPGGMLLSGKDEILASIAAQPWTSCSLEGTRVLPLAEKAAAVIYRATAQREGSAPYVALVSTVYVGGAGRWKLALHQQTPL